MIKIFITEDQELYLEGLTLLLNSQPGLQVTGSCRNGAQLLQSLPHMSADMLLLDVYLPDFDPEELIKKVRFEKPEIKIVFLTIMRGTRLVHKLIKYNIQGYILKNAELDELVYGLKAVAGGGQYFSNDINIAADPNVKTTVSMTDNKIREILTRRETEILQLVCKEYSNMEIAEKLFLSVGTVETHRKKLISKLGVNNTIGLVKFAIKNDLL
ncbi:MAG: response regulator transcription factor [Chitinophagaceae bacterium]|nr:response regulator transcription factor [Chitinophagaceae bacterium]